ncbi:hypothetical protein ACWPMX_00665 [Tsuneonella sp. HG094]
MRRAFFVRILSLVLACLAGAWSPAAFAKVTMSFHSFNGSFPFGRYPHTFIVLEGTDDATGRTVNENYGFSARSAGPAVLAGPVAHIVMTEKAKYIKTTNRHFSVELSDDQFRRVTAEVARWRNAPGKYYSLDSRNCIHFVGAMAEIVGITVDYPQDLLRKPKAWLNHISARNPRLGAKQL